MYTKVINPQRYYKAEEQKKAAIAIGQVKVIFMFSLFKFILLINTNFNHIFF